MILTYKNVNYIINTSDRNYSGCAHAMQSIVKKWSCTEVVVPGDDVRILLSV